MTKTDQQAFEAWLATRKDCTVYDRRDLEMAWLDGKRQGGAETAAVTQQRDELVEAANGLTMSRGELIALEQETQEGLQLLSEALTRIQSAQPKEQRDEQ